MIEIDRILQTAVEKRASDIHIIKNMKPIYRVNRILEADEKSTAVTCEDLEEVFKYFTLENPILSASYKRENKLDVNYDFNDTRMRVNISKSCGDYTFTVRIIRKELPDFSELGLPDIVKRLAFLPQGLILVTGKSNSGKTTTLNTLVNEINRVENQKILMLEDPIEFLHESNHSLIVQKEIGEGKDCVSFGEGVKNALREDCDVLIIGEIRDRDTMESALDMVEAGHLVIGTMHTKSASETVDRVLNFFGPTEQMQIKCVLSSVLKAVVTQRLLVGKKGSLVMVPEIMIVDDAIAGLIRKEKFSKSSMEDAIQSRAERGNVSFLNSLAYAVLKNKVSLEQANAQLDDNSKETLKRLLMQLK